MNYKLGDEVKLRSDLVEGKKFGSYHVFSDVARYIGKKVTISEVFERSGYYNFIGSVGRGYLTDEMIDDKSIKKEKEVVVLSNTSKEEVDIYEESEDLNTTTIRYNETVNMWMSMHDKKTFRIIMKNHITTLIQQYDKKGGISDLDELVEYTKILKNWELNE